MNPVAQIVGVAFLGAIVLVLAWKGIRSIHVKAGPVTVDVDTLKRELEPIQAKVNKIEDSVNNHPLPLTDRMRLVEGDVGQLRRSSDWQRDAIRVIARRLGGDELCRELPAEPTEAA